MVSQFGENSIRNLCLAFIQLNFRFLQRVCNLVGRSSPYYARDCQFGNHTYELEERWRPDLGPPFGMLYCMRCECIPREGKKSAQLHPRHFTVAMDLVFCENNPHVAWKYDINN
ncbi:hypothetical protein TNCV_789491 [Trichonephila clavipes]|nr:hypothetical protein TNCV_789491 [Trichonephila clavipes]